MKIETLSIEGPLLLTPVQHADGRGYFSEVFRQDQFDQAVGERVVFVQDNHSRSEKSGTLRGLHLQTGQAAQGKLVRVTRGAVFDVAVDVRPNSSTFLRYVGAELSNDNWRQLWIPPGFLHGFLTLTPDVEFLYKVTAFYSREHELSVAWNDPDIGIEWPVSAEALTISKKDRNAPFIRDISTML